MSIIALRILGAYHAVFSIILVALMLASMPLGAYVVIEAHNNPNFVDPETIDNGTGLLSDTSAPYVFGIAWAAYAAMLAVAMMGPRTRITGAIRALVSCSVNGSWLHNNHMLAVLSWFSILILCSALIDLVQEGVDVKIESPDYGGELERFYHATRAPIIEEIGFRVLLIGIPLAALYVLTTRPVRLLRSLLSPFSVHGARSVRPAIILIIVSAIIFGALHIIGDGSWSIGKVTQAGMAGVILGWVYYRYGLLAAILVHWATNYFVLAIIYFLALTLDLAVADALVHPTVYALEVLLVASGVVSAALMIVGRRKAALGLKGI